MEFNSSTPTSQTFFFTNQAVTVTGSEIKPVKRENYRSLSIFLPFPIFAAKI